MAGHLVRIETGMLEPSSAVVRGGWSSATEGGLPHGMVGPSTGSGVIPLDVPPSPLEGGSPLAGWFQHSRRSSQEEEQHSAVSCFDSYLAAPRMTPATEGKFMIHALADLPRLVAEMLEARRHYSNRPTHALLDRLKIRQYLIDFIVENILTNEQVLESVEPAHLVEPYSAAFAKLWQTLPKWAASDTDATELMQMAVNLSAVAEEATFDTPNDETACLSLMSPTSVLPWLAAGIPCLLAFATVLVLLLLPATELRTFVSVGLCIGVCFFSALSGRLQRSLLAALAATSGRHTTLVGSADRVTSAVALGQLSSDAPPAQSTVSFSRIVAGNADSSNNPLAPTVSAAGSSSLRNGRPPGIHSGAGGLSPSTSHVELAGTGLSVLGGGGGGPGVSILSNNNNNINNSSYTGLAYAFSDPAAAAQQQQHQHTPQGQPLLSRHPSFTGGGNSARTPRHCGSPTESMSLGAVPTDGTIHAGTMSISSAGGQYMPRGAPITSFGRHPSSHGMTTSGFSAVPSQSGGRMSPQPGVFAAGNNSIASTGFGQVGILAASGSIAPNAMDSLADARSPPASPSSSAMGGTTNGTAMVIPAHAVVPHDHAARPALRATPFGLWSDGSLLTENSSMCFIIVDERWIVHYWNFGVAMATGFVATDVVGASLEDIVDPSGIDALSLVSRKPDPDAVIVFLKSPHEVAVPFFLSAKPCLDQAGWLVIAGATAANFEGSNNALLGRSHRLMARTACDGALRRLRESAKVSVIGGGGRRSESASKASLSNSAQQQQQSTNPMAAFGGLLPPLQRVAAALAASVQHERVVACAMAGWQVSAPATLACGLYRLKNTVRVELVHPAPQFVECDRAGVDYALQLLSCLCDVPDVTFPFCGSPPTSPKAQEPARQQPPPTVSLVRIKVFFSTSDTAAALRISVSVDDPSRVPFEQLSAHCQSMGGFVESLDGAVLVRPPSPAQRQDPHDGDGPNASGPANGRGGGLHLPAPAPAPSVCPAAPSVNLWFPASWRPQASALSGEVRRVSVSAESFGDLSASTAALGLSVNDAGQTIPVPERVVATTNAPPVDSTGTPLPLFLVVCRHPVHRCRVTQALWNAGCDVIFVDDDICVRTIPVNRGQLRLVEGIVVDSAQHDAVVLVRALRRRFTDALTMVILADANVKDVGDLSSLADDHRLVNRPFRQEAFGSIIDAIMSQRFREVWAPLHLEGGIARTVPWRRSKRLGSGTFGEVYEAENATTGERMAVKIVHIGSSETVDVERARELLNEMDIMSSLNHPHVVRYLCCERAPQAVNILMELCRDGTLATHLQQKGTMPIPEAVASMRQIVSAMVYLHQAGIVHRDIKPENVLLGDGCLKVSDFGTAVRLAPSQLLITTTGTLRYMAPEIWKGEEYSFPCDIWSLGVLFLHMIGSPPPHLLRATNFGLYHYYISDLKENLVPLPNDLPPDVFSFVRQCLQTAPELRPTAENLLYHPLLLEGAGYALPQWKHLHSPGHKGAQRRRQSLVNGPFGEAVVRPVAATSYGGDAALAALAARVGSNGTISGYPSFAALNAALVRKRNTNVSVPDDGESPVLEDDSISRGGTSGQPLPMPAIAVPNKASASRSGAASVSQSPMGQNSRDHSKSMLGSAGAPTTTTTSTTTSPAAGTATGAGGTGRRTTGPNAMIANTSSSSLAGSAAPSAVRYLGGSGFLGAPSGPVAAVPSPISFSHDPPSGSADDDSDDDMIPGVSPNVGQRFAPAPSRPAPPSGPAALSHSSATTSSSSAGASTIVGASAVFPALAPAASQMPRSALKATSKVTATTSHQQQQQFSPQPQPQPKPSGPPAPSLGASADDDDDDDDDIIPRSQPTLLAPAATPVAPPPSAPVIASRTTVPLLSFDASSARPSGSALPLPSASVGGRGAGPAPPANMRGVPSGPPSNAVGDSDDDDDDALIPGMS